MKKLFSLYAFFFLMFLLTSKLLFCPTVGADSSAAVQQLTFFPELDSGPSNTNASAKDISELNQSEVENIMFGFSAFEKGFVLENDDTVCVFDAFFPILRNFTLNGGTLLFNRDMIQRAPLFQGVGRIGGNGFSIEFPNNTSSVDIPSINHKHLIKLQDTENIASVVNSVDWSFNDQYVAMVCNAALNINEIQVFELQAKELVLTGTLNLGDAVNNGNAVRWHPSENRLAVGQVGNDELTLYQWNSSTNELVITDTFNYIGEVSVNALSWHSTGNYLAVGKDNDTQIYVYEVNSGKLGTEFLGTFTGVQTVQPNAIDWDSTGSYIAAGFNVLGNELKIFHFDGIQVSLDIESLLISTVNVVAWHPTKPLLAVGLNIGSDLLRIFEHNANAKTLAEITSARTGEPFAVHDLHWSADGVYLAVVTAENANGLEVKVFEYDATEKELHLVTGHSSLSTTRAVRFSRNQNFLLTGDESNNLSLFDFDIHPLIFDNLKLFFNSNIQINGPLKFSGNCILNGGGNILTMQAGGSIEVQKDSLLILEQCFIKGVKSNNIRCADNSASLFLRDLIWTQDADVTFSVGSFSINKDVVFAGEETTFAYQSIITSTVTTESSLTLDGNITFSYDPFINSKDLIHFVDNSAKLKLKGATLHSTSTGMNLKRGSIVVKGDCSFSSDVIIQDEITILNEGISFGDGSSVNDCTIDIDVGSFLILTKGSLVYNNVQESSLRMGNQLSSISITPESTFDLRKTITLGEGRLLLSNAANLIRQEGVKINGSVNIVK